MKDYNETNKLIAEFMGLHLRTIYIGGEPVGKYYFTGASIHDYVSDFEEDTPYHKDWNALMEVVEKIEAIGHMVEININYCRVGSLSLDTPIETSAQTKLEATYQAVVSFIKWYKTNGKT